MSTNQAPSAPRELAESGRALWRAVTGEYELEEHEVGLLLEMCRTRDTLDRLAAITAAEGPMVTTAAGEPKAHPALVEARQLRIAYARLSAALRLPAGEEGDERGQARRPQRRVGARGVYRLGSVS